MSDQNPAPAAQEEENPPETLFSVAAKQTLVILDANATRLRLAKELQYQEYGGQCLYWLEGKRANDGTVQMSTDVKIVSEKAALEMLNDLELYEVSGALQPFLNMAMPVAVCVCYGEKQHGKVFVRAVLMDVKELFQEAGVEVEEYPDSDEMETEDIPDTPNGSAEG